MSRFWYKLRSMPNIYCNQTSEQDEPTVPTISNLCTLCVTMTLLWTLFHKDKIHFQTSPTHFLLIICFKYMISCSGFYNKLLYTGWLKEQIIISTILQVKNSKIKVTCWFDIWFIAHCHLAVTSHGRKGKRVVWELFYKGIYIIHKGSTLTTSSPPKGPMS